MTKKDLEDSMQKVLGDWTSKRKLKKYLRCGDVYLNSLLENVSYRVQGRANLYFVKDICECLKKDLVRRPS